MPGLRSLRNRLAVIFALIILGAIGTIYLSVTPRLEASLIAQRLDQVETSSRQYTPEVGGFTSLEAQLMIRALRGLDLIGADVVEVSPPFDPSGLTALTGATIMFELLCVLADAVAARKSRR